MYETGCTVSELVNIQVSHFSSGKLYIPAEHTKSKRARTLSISRELLRDVQKYAKLEGAVHFLFETRQSARPSTRRVEQILKDLSKAAHVAITPRQLRKLRLESLLKDQTSTDEIREQLGIYSLRDKQISSKEEILAAKRVAGTSRDRLLISIMQETGCNVSELVAIRVGDVTKKGILMHLAKKDATSTRPISGQLFANVKDFSKGKKPDEYLFSTRQSTQLTPRRIQQILKQISLEQGIDVSSRKIRNAFGAELSRKASVEEMQERLGIEHVNVYTHGVMRR